MPKNAIRYPKMPLYVSFKYHEWTYLEALEHWNAGLHPTRTVKMFSISAWNSSATVAGFPDAAFNLAL
jgi:hypothetical protein